MQVRVRFAPSPTGLLHIGNAHTALFNWLFARQRGGVVVLRAEDTDLVRSEASYEKEICRDLKWLGLDWDEGLELGGAYGPYRQSEREDFYHTALEKLKEGGYVYPCYCSVEELAQQREADRAAGIPPRYRGTCRELAAEKRREFEAQGRKPAWRFLVPEKEQIEFRDLIRGEFSFSGEEIGDFVVVRPSGIPTYNFAVVVDDLAMAITHIIRADEHLSNTPRQVVIYQALGEKVPEFAHVAMLLGPDRQKLSKRHGAVSVAEYRKCGYLPEALLNYLALLGWTPKSGEILSREELIAEFQLEKVALSPGIFDQEKLRWVAGQYMRAAENTRLAALARPFLEEAGLISDSSVDIVQMMELLKHNIVALEELPPWAEPYLKEPVFTDQKLLEVIEGEDAKRVFQAFHTLLGEKEKLTASEIKALLASLPEKLGLGKGKVYRPLRLVLTGQGRGPELDQLISLLGPEVCRKRLAKFL